MYSLIYIYDWIATKIGSSSIWQMATKSVFSCVISMLLLVATFVLLAAQAPIASPWGYVVVLIWIAILVLLVALAINIGRKLFGN